MTRWVTDEHARADRVGDRSLVADGRQPGGHPARLERGHACVPVGREGAGDHDDLLGATRLRRDRAASFDRCRVARERRREPRQPALRRGGRGDPHRQPDRVREEGEPRLPGVSRQRRQRDADARPVHVGGDPGMDGRVAGDPPRRATTRSPRRDLPADARRALRLRARPDRLRCPARHDARPFRRLRDVLQLRRGRAPLRSRAGRHARGAPKARRQVRADRPGQAVLTAALQDRRPLRPRADPGRDLQAAQRVRPRRPRRTVARHAATCRTWPVATSSTRWSETRWPRRRAAARRRRRPRTTCPVRTPSCSARATSVWST